MLRMVKRLYDWILGWAETPYGAFALFTLAFAESSFFPIPPDVLLIALVFGSRTKAFRYAATCTAGSVLGALVGYGIGFFLWWTPYKTFSPVALFFFNIIPGFTEPLFYRIKELFDSWDFWIIFTAGFTPIPYKVFTIAGGAFQIDVIMFTIASIIGRGARFFLLALLLWEFGERIKNFIDRYFNVLTLGTTAVLIILVIVLKGCF